MSGPSTTLQLLESPSVKAYAKKMELKGKFRDDVQACKHAEHEEEMVRVLVALVEKEGEHKEGDELEVRKEAARCLPLLGKYAALSRASLSRLLACAAKMTKEALRQEGNLKEEPARVAYADALGPVIAKCDQLPPRDVRSLLEDVVLLLRKTRDGGSLSLTRQTLCLILRLGKTGIHAAALNALRPQWLEEFGQHIRVEKDVETKKLMVKHIWNVENGVCETTDQAKRLEDVAVRGLAAAADFKHAFETLELVCAAAGPHFLALALNPQSPSRALLDEATRKRGTDANGRADEEANKMRKRGWAVWCQACVQADKVGVLSLAHVAPALKTAAEDATGAKLLVQELSAPKGLWERIVTGAALMVERLGELEGLLRSLAECGKGDVGLAHELWNGMFARLVTEDDTIEPRVLLAHGHTLLCSLVFSGICSVAMEERDRSRLAMLNDQVKKMQLSWFRFCLSVSKVRTFAKAFVVALGKAVEDAGVPREAKVALLRNWIQCTRPGSKTILPTGLAHLRKTIQLGLGQRDLLYGAFVSMGLLPTVRALSTAPAHAALVAMEGVFPSTVACLAIVVLRCRLKSPPPGGDPLEQNILLDCAAVLQLAEAAGHAEFVAQMHVLSRDLIAPSCFGALTDPASLVFRVRAWTVVATECLTRLGRAPGTLSCNAKGKDHILSDLVSIVLALYSGAESQEAPEPQVVHAWTDALRGAGEAWVLLLELADASELSSSLTGLFEEGYRALILRDTLWKRLFRPLTRQLCLFLCHRVSPALQKRWAAPSIPSLVLTVSSGENNPLVQQAEPTVRLSRAMSQISVLLQLEEQAHGADPVREGIAALTASAAGVCRSVTPESEACVGVLVGLQPLLEAWVKTSDDLLNAVLEMAARCCDKTHLPPLDCMREWLSACLESPHHPIYDPAMRYWRECVCKLGELRWSDDWKALIARLRVANESDFSLPPGVPEPHSVASAGSLLNTPNKRPREEASPSLQLDDDDDGDGGGARNGADEEEGRVGGLAPTQIVEDDPPNVPSEAPTPLKRARSGPQNGHNNNAVMGSAVSLGAELEAELELDGEAPEAPARLPGRPPELTVEERMRLITDNFKLLSLPHQVPLTRTLLLDILGVTETAKIIANILKGHQQ
jgi:hypothetical protein